MLQLRYHIPLFLLFVLPVAVFAQDGKKNLSLDDYKHWRSVGSVQLSDNGNWVSYSYQQPEKESTLIFENLETGKKQEIKRGTRPQFSDNSEWVTYTVSPPKAKKGEKPKPDAGKENEKPAKSTFILFDLKGGKKQTYQNISSSKFSKGSAFVALKKGGVVSKPPQSSDLGSRPSRGPNVASRAPHSSDLILRDLKTGKEEIFGNVLEFHFNKPGNLLAYTVDAADKIGNGLYLIDLASGKRQTLDYARANYSKLTWSEEGEAIALLKGNDKEGYQERPNDLLVFSNLSGEKVAQAVLQPAKAFGFPQGMVLSSRGSLSFSDDLSKVFFSLKEQQKKPPKADPSKKVANLDIWHWKDQKIQSVQMLQAGREKNKTYQGVFLLEKKKFVQLTDKTMERLSVTRNGKWGIGQDNRAYIHDWKEPRSDFYRLNIETGERTLFLKAHQRGLGLSPHSTHYLYWDQGHIWSYTLSTGEKTNLTEKAPVSFANSEYDHPGQVPPYGITGWSHDGKSVILTHQFDLWVQPLDGSVATSLTKEEGSQTETTFRYIKTDAEEKFIDLTKPLLFSAVGKWTKKEGYARLVNDKLESLVSLDKHIGRLTQAKKGDRLLFTLETFQEYPDYYTSNKNFANISRLTTANPQQVEYHWGRNILIDYTNKDGVRLQGVLSIPDGYQEGQKLPMLVSFYEKMSQNLHRYKAPRYSSSPQAARFVSNGYLFLQPDVHFRTRTSHSDMKECVEAAVAKVVELGYADPTLVGLHGHSYSGQGSAYISTHSDKFAAILAGAAATNLVSDFNQLWKDSGTNQHRYDTYGQGRFGTNPFDDFELYVDQSAVHHARNMNTPLLLLHGTADGAVEWLQAVEFYNALRYNEKNVILLSYPGEGHSLRKRENQLDFQVRMHQFFDHHLKGKAPADWMVRGVPFLNKKK
ncbi:MAG: prolyl oligopeptidase family serine peptidase [Pirellulaceae bacterium]|nr:prolyl oligopeptidase family serine peptidase [Pirellulaceae bacterium]